MKVQLQEQPKEFKPVSITLTFETQQEFDDFKTLVAYNRIVTECLQSVHGETVPTLRDNLCNIYDCFLDI